jgi:hypothetical protein
MISNNDSLDRDAMSLPIRQLVEILLALWQDDKVLPKVLNESR